VEKIQILEAQEQKLLAHLKKRVNIGMTFIAVGLIGVIPTIISFFSDTGTVYHYNSTFIFSILGVLFLGQSHEFVKKIKKGEYQVYKAECKKVGWEHAFVENNDILSKNPKKAIKKLVILGSAKSLKTGEEIGVLQVGKEFMAFSLQ